MQALPHPDRPGPPARGCPYLVGYYAAAAGVRAREGLGHRGAGMLGLSVNRGLLLFGKPRGVLLYLLVLFFIGAAILAKLTNGPLRALSLRA